MFKDSNDLLKQISQRHPEARNFQFHRINGLDIPFDPNWKNIAVNLSGGADSASLCMLLARIIKNNNYDCKIHVITFVRCWDTRPWQQPISVDVFNKLKEMFPGIVYQRHEAYIPPELEFGVVGTLTSSGNSSGHNRLEGDRSGDMIYNDSFNSYITYRYNLDATFNATSKNPKGVTLDTHYDRAPKREKDAVEGELHDLIFLSKKSKKWFVTPYRFVQKDWILAQYYIFNAEDLLDTTRSCEGDLSEEPIKKEIPSLEDYSAGKYVPLCNICFWCLERAWAEENCQQILRKIDD